LPPLLSDLANAALLKGLPMLEGWLRERLGKDAQIDRITVDGSRVVVAGAQLPFHPRMQLRLERATIALGARGLSGPRPYVEAAEGVLEIDGGGRKLRARVSLARGREDGDFWLSGPVAVTACTLEAWRLGEPVEMAGRLEVRLGATAWEIRGAMTGDVAFDIDAGGALGTAAGRRVREVRIALRKCSAGQGADLAACWLDLPMALPAEAPWAASGRGDVRWLDGELTLATTWRGATLPRGRLPDPLQVDGRVRFGAALDGELTVASARSAVTVAPLVRAASGKLDGTRVRLEVALADAIAAGVFPAAFSPTPRGAVVAELAVAGEALRGTLDAPLVEIESALRPSLPWLSLAHAGAAIEITRLGVALREVAFDVEGTRFSGSAELAPGATSVALRVVDAGPKLVEALAALAERARVATAGDGPRPPGARWLPRDLRVSGEVALAADRSLAAEVAVETSATLLIANLRLSGERALDGSAIRGRVGLADLHGLGLFDGPVAPEPAGRLSLDATLEGTLAEPRVVAKLGAASLRFPLGPRFVLPLEDVRAVVLADRESVVWKEAEARLAGGRVASEGVVGFTAAFAGVDCDVRAEEVRVGDVADAGRFVEGRLGGAFHLRRQRGALSGEGELALSEPRYPAIALARAALDDVGLPLPPAEGIGPATCKVRLADGAAHVSELAAQLEGVAVSGEGRVAFTGEIEAEARLRVAAPYLRKSRLLVVPATLAGGVTLPIRIGGTLREPRVQADLRGALRHKLRTKEIAAAVTGAVAKVRDRFAEKAAPPGVRGAPAARSGVEAIVDRALADSPETDALVERLLDAGIDADEIVEILERRGIRL
jgi:Fe2+ transport system protein FeoA